MKREVLILVSCLYLFLLPAFAEEVRYPVKHNQERLKKSAGDLGLRGCFDRLLSSCGKMF